MAANEILSLEQAQELATRITNIPGVAGLHSGQFGEYALLFAGGRVAGLDIDRSGDEPRLGVAIIADGNTAKDLNQLAQQVQQVVSDATGAIVDVKVADIELTNPELGLAVS